MIRPKHSTPNSSSAIFEIENWVGLTIFPVTAETFYPSKKVADDYVKRVGRPTAIYRKVKVARRGRSLYLLTPIRRGPK